MAEDQRDLIQEQNQKQAQVLRFEDELHRKRMQVQAE
jgi:ATPase family AAA domain-containing protein 3A/B